MKEKAAAAKMTTSNEAKEGELELELTATRAQLSLTTAELEREELKTSLFVAKLASKKAKIGRLDEDLEAMSS